MERTAYPHLTDNPWRIIELKEGWRSGTGLIPIKRSLNALDDKIRHTLEYEFHLVRNSSGNCVKSPTGNAQRSINIAGMFADTAPIVSVTIVKAMVCMKLQISYANMMSLLHGGRRQRLYRQCKTGSCIQPDHYRLNRAIVAKALDHLNISDEPVPTGPFEPIDVPTHEFYSEFESVLKLWFDEFGTEMGTPRYRDEINSRAYKWLTERLQFGKTFVKAVDPMDLMHPLILMEAGYQVEPSDEVKSLFDIKPSSQHIDGDALINMLRRDK